MIWKPNARHNQSKKIGSIFELKDNKLGIRIHKYMGCGDTLFLSCYPLSINTMDLKTEDFNEAVRIAKKND